MNAEALRRRVRRGERRGKIQMIIAGSARIEALSFL
jgi:hypothetical protein